MPMGFRFSPTESELVECLGSMIRASEEEVVVVSAAEGFIHPANIYEHHPLTLTGMYPPAHDVRGEWYFFTGREARYPKGRRPDRRAGDAGFWKATSGVKNVKDYRGQIIGRKMTLVFYESESGNNITKKKQYSAAEKTNWIMHEYERMSTSTESNADQFQSWVLCRIHHGGKEPPAASEPLLLEEDSPSSSFLSPHTGASRVMSCSQLFPRISRATTSSIPTTTRRSPIELDWNLEEGLLADMLSDLLDHD
ncbi:hypothetical protein H6P81_020611 [Aristolochia fimbriata]|uniref:NAC domain-containing protein n=1 Tax=Aristolochia fimbriata TaxID=158543 RepID=A0AAV7DXW9_ARIFI|nr:hypothetical protein H6P81_020611 [Aristolochia fimbriata]